MPRSPFVGFRVTETLLKALSERTNEPGLTARRDLIRYYYVLALTLAALAARPLLTHDEACLLVDACKDIAFQETLPPLWGLVADVATREGLGPKWGVDVDGLAHRLRALSPYETFALIDAVERFWRSQDHADITADLVAVGLLQS